jgi:hypothetical protein
MSSSRVTFLGHVEGMERKRNTQVRTVLFCAITQRVGNFLPTFRDNLSVPSKKDSWALKMGPIDCPETSVRNYHYLLHNSPEKHRSHLSRPGNLKSFIEVVGGEM